MSPTKTYYLGGPMTGYPQFNFPAFDRAAERLRKHGYDIISPAELDDEATRESALASADGKPGSGSHNGETWGDFLARDVKLIADKVDGAIFLDGWEKSKGARLEALVCVLKGKPVYRYLPRFPGLKVQIDPVNVANGIVGDLLEEAEEVAAIETIERESEETAETVALFGNDETFTMTTTVTQEPDGTMTQSAGEIRVVDPETGGEKGQKIARFDLIPAEVQRQDALVYGAGSKKYDDDNWRKGFAWRLSLGSLHRHLNAWVQGEDNDPELSELAGEPVSHLACVRWHAATLFTFQAEGLGTNDIPERS